MKIERINITSFGKLAQKSITLSDEINLIHGCNEAGKSTLLAFIKMMFYAKTANNPEAELKKYVPWDSEGIEGDVVFSANDTEYKVYRNIIGTKNKFEFIDNKTGKAVFADRKKEPPGDIIFGISKNTFEDTLFIRQLGSAPTSQSKDEIQKRLTNLSQTGSEDTSYKKAMDKLGTAEKSLNASSFNNAKGEILRTQDIIEEIRGDISRQSKIILDLNEKSESLENLITAKNKLEQQNAEIDSLKDKAQAIETVKTVKRLEKFSSTIEQFKSEKVKIEQELKFGDFVVSADYFVEFDKLKQRQGDYSEQVAEQRGKVDKHQEVVQKLYEDKHFPPTVKQDIFEAYAKIDVKHSAEKQANEIEKDILELTQQKDALQTEIDNDSKIFRNSGGSIMSEQEIEAKLARKVPLAAFVTCGVIFALCVLMVFLTPSFAVVCAVLAISAAAVFVVLRKKQGRGVDEIVSRFGTSDINVIKERILKYNQGIEDLNKFDLSIRAKAEYKSTIKIGDVTEQLNFIDDLYKKTGTIDKESLNAAVDEAIKERQESAATLKACEKGLAEAKDRLLGVEGEIARHYGKCFGKADDFSLIFNKMGELKSKLDQLSKIESNLALEQAKYNGLLAGKNFDELKILVEGFAHGEEALLKSATEYNDDQRNINSELNSVNTKIGETRQIISELRGKNGAYGDLEERLKLEKAHKEECEQKLAAVLLAKEALKKTFEEFNSEFAPVLNETAGVILCKLTNGRHEQMRVAYHVAGSAGNKKSDRFAIKIGSSANELSLFSSGTQDQAYFALRMAISELMSGVHDVPIFLDDAFVQYDDDRIRAALEYLTEVSNKRQIIMFSCHSREMDYFKKVENANYNVNYIEI